MKTLKESILGNVGLDPETNIKDWFKEHCEGVSAFHNGIEITIHDRNNKYIVDIKSSDPLIISNADSLNADGLFEWGEINCALLIEHCPKIKNLKEISTIKWSKDIHGYDEYAFIISYCNELRDLEGFPKNIPADYKCSIRNCGNLQSLKGLSKSCMNLHIWKCNLQSLKGCNTYMNYLHIAEVDGLKDFKGAPKEISNEFHATQLKDIISLDGWPSKIGHQAAFASVGSYYMPSKFTLEDVVSRCNLSPSQIDYF